MIDENILAYSLLYQNVQTYKNLTSEVMLKVYLD